MIFDSFELRSIKRGRDMIVPTLAKLIFREHLYKPIQGRVLCLGRQTVAMTYEQAIELLQDEGCPVPIDILQEKIPSIQDQETRYGEGTGYISDQYFFSLLGIKDLFVMDVSSYEDADIAHDLNIPIPDSLRGQFDFIIDGGTFDHLFDLRVAFENVVSLLKSDGRIFQWNAASNFVGAAYLSFGPDLFYDYYVLNKFADCKIYLAETDSTGQLELWDFYEFEGSGNYDHFQSDRILMVIVLAEKNSSSTSDRLPVQAQYRDPNLWGPYKATQKLFPLSERKSLLGSHSIAKKMYGSKLIYSFTLLRTKLRKEGIIWVLKKLAVRIRKEWKPIGYKYIGKI